MAAGPISSGDAMTKIKSIAPRSGDPFARLTKIKDGGFGLRLYGGVELLHTQKT